MKTMHLFPLEHRRNGNKITRACDVRYLDGETMVRNFELWFEFVGVEQIPDDKDCEAYLLTMVMDAMKSGRDIVIHGGVSHGLLSNLIEYQEAWHSWLPATYRQIDFKVAEIREGLAGKPGAICAFSGGVERRARVRRDRLDREHRQPFGDRHRQRRGGTDGGCAVTQRNPPVRGQLRVE